MTFTMAKSKLNSFSYLQIKKSCRSLDQQTKHNISVMLLLTGRLPSRVEKLLADDIIVDWTSDWKSVS